MKEMTAKEVQHRLEAGESLNIIDVREREKITEGHIKGIIHIPLGELESRVSELDENKEYILVCRSSVRSAKATAYLEALGYNAINLAGGMMAWERNVEKNF